MKPLSLFTALTLLAGLPAILAQTPPTLTYIPHSSVKLYQVNGDCDWAAWDATITNPPTCKPTVSQTETRADVLGDDVPVAFENNGELIVTFGDTIGAVGYGAWTNVQNSFQWHAHDPIARSTTASASDGLLLNFFLNGNHGLEVLPPPQPNGTPVDMGIDDIPHAGVSLNGTIYLGIKTGNVSLGNGNNDQSHDYSLLATFDETTQTFTSGHTISTLPDGHFVGPTFYLAVAGILGTPPPVSPEPVMLIFGVGAFRASNVYLSVIPSTEFASGVDQNGNGATRYFSGMSNGQPTWSSSESSAVPVVTDLDPAHPTISNVSVFYSQPLGLWLMVYDGGRGSLSTEGLYFTYALHPWGPWTTPQLVFDACRDKGFGNFIFYYYATAAENTCPSAMPAGVTSAPNSAGPAGPTIGDQTANDPHTTRGATYAPAFVERFTIISGNTLKLFYMFSTWNPYAVVMMESDFNISSEVTTLPHVADGNGFDTLILLINTGTTDASYSLQFFNQSGAPVTYPLDPTQSGMTGTNAAGAQAIVRTAGSGSTTHLGWGQLTAPAGVKGMVIYQQQASPTSLQEGSVPFTTPSQHFFVPFDNVGAATSIGFVNPSATQTATVNLTVRYETGGTDTVPAFQMNPLQQMAEPLTGIWAATAGQRGLIEVNSNTPIGLVAFRFERAAFTLFDTIADTAGGALPITSTIAHSADGNNFRSTFLLTNSGTVDEPYTLGIFGPTGEPLTFGFDVASPLSGMVPAGSALTIDTTGLGSVTQLGWAQLMAAPAVSGIEIFRQTNLGKSEQQATIPISQTNLDHFFLPFDSVGNTTAIALANPDAATTANVSVTLRFTDGTSSAGQFMLAPRNYGAEGVATLLPATAGKAGVAEFTSNIPVAVVEVRFNRTGAFTSLRAVGP